jgi:hypothetical protein
MLPVSKGITGWLVSQHKGHKGKQMATSSSEQDCFEGSGCMQVWTMDSGYHPQGWFIVVTAQLLGLHELAG